MSYGNEFLFLFLKLFLSFMSLPSSEKNSSYTIIIDVDIEILKVVLILRNHALKQSLG